MDRKKEKYMRSKSSCLPIGVKLRCLGKPALFSIALIGALGLGVAHASGQTSASNSSNASKSSAGVSRTATSVTYRRGGTAKVSFQGTDLMTRGVGEARVENKGNRVEIEANFENMDQATKFGFEYLTYVLWAVSPQGRAVNLGEVQIKNGSAQVKAITDMQTFGMVV